MTEKYNKCNLKTQYTGLPSEQTYRGKSEMEKERIDNIQNEIRRYTRVDIQKSHEAWGIKGKRNPCS